MTQDEFEYRLMEAIGTEPYGPRLRGRVSALIRQFVEELSVLQQFLRKIAESDDKAKH